VVQHDSLELGEIEGGLGEHSEARRADLGEAAAHEIAPALGAAETDLKAAR
jgi:hypothetical protein